MKRRTTRIFKRAPKFKKQKQNKTGNEQCPLYPLDDLDYNERDNQASRFGMSIGALEQRWRDEEDDKSNEFSILYI